MKKIAITGIIGWDVTAQDIREALRAAAGEDVTFEISSPGGLVSTGLEIFNLIRNYSGHTTAVLSGYAMSMASYIPLACDRVVAEDNAVYMVHNARGGVWGDHNDILSYGAYVKGLSGLLGKQYVRTTGKAAAEVTGWMDKETFFFGEEMVEAGFVHEIIATDKDKDKAAALAGAQAVFGDTMARLSKDAAQAREDMIKASSILNVATQPPAPAGKPQKEVQQMALAELLAQNPAAKAEFDAALAAARTEGAQAVRTTIAAVTPILESAVYPAAIKAVAVKALKGDTSADTLTTTVAVFDAMKEEQAAAAAAAETGATPPTPPQQPAATIDPAKPISCQEELDAEIARAKGGK
jgi:ATP-dependent protease ClpP protease subunit